jgi:phosphoribosyl 1,2-cyclic phosphate phosphodiesterase
MSLEATILGCGSSGGVPRVGGDWGVCDPEDPRNRRLRSSILVRYRAEGKSESTDVLVDTSPDLREQLLRANVGRVDALVFTHDHADQCHGIDDMRAVAYRMRTQIPTYMDAPTAEQLTTRFNYCFEMPEGRVHPPILKTMPLIEHGKAFSVDGPGGAVEILPIELSHGPTPSLGLVFNGALAYTPDVHDIAHESLNLIHGCDVWICDALRYHTHPTHAHADKSLSWQARTGVPKMVLTNLHIDMDYATLAEELPGSQEPAVDGMVIAVG